MDENELFSELHKRLSYNSETGVFTWINSIAPQVKPGSIAGNLNDQGYSQISFLGKRYRAHRLAWLMTYGKWPTYELDHINGIRDDNRIVNLRDIPHSENLSNIKKKYKNNSNGFLGVSMRRNRYVAKITVKGKGIHLGSFNSAEEAHVAYINAKREHHAGCTI